MKKKFASRCLMQLTCLCSILIITSITGTPSIAKWHCPFPDEVQRQHYCYGVTPVPVNDAERNQKEKETEKNNNGLKTEAAITASNQAKQATSTGGSGSATQANPGPPPSSTLGAINFGPKDETADIKISGERPSEFTSKAKDLTNSLIEATIMALKAKKKIEEDAKEIAQLIQQAASSTNVRADMAFNSKVKAKLAEVMALKNTLMQKLIEIEALKQQFSKINDQTPDVKTNAIAQTVSTSDVVIQPYNPESPWSFLDDQTLQYLFDYKPEDIVPDIEPTQAEKDQQKYEKLVKDFMEKGMTEEQAKAAADKVKAQLEQFQGSDADKQKQLVQDMHNNPGKYGMTQEQADAAGKATQNYGDKNAAPVSSKVTSNADAQKYIGNYVNTAQSRAAGNPEQCASLTKALAPEVGAASTWRPGQQVQGNTNIPVGTPVATFNNGSYGPPGAPGGASGQSHTGIYMGQNSDGVQILNQWNGSGGARVSTIPWSSWNGNTKEGGNKYYTITH